MPIVPSGDRTKSIATGAPYSPTVSFNPDKKAFFDTHVTTFGVLSADLIVSDGSTVTVPSGTSFIQNGIIVTLTQNFAVPIPAMPFPKFLMASVDSEVPSSNVTIEFQGTSSAPLVELARLDPNNTTVIQAKQVSIRALRQDIDLAVASSGLIDTFQDTTLVKVNVDELAVEGPNVTMSDVGGTRSRIGVTLDVQENTVPVTAKTDTINFAGPGVSVTASSASSATVNIGGVSGVVPGGIVDGLVDGHASIRQFVVTGAIFLRNGILSAPVTTTVALSPNVSGNPRTDLLEWNGTSLGVVQGTPSADAPCPDPTPGSVPIAVALVPNAASSRLDSMNKQSSLSAPVIVAHYYACGGLHASRVGVTLDPTTNSTTYVDAQEMLLSVHFPRTGYRYELAWDAVIEQNLYGFLSEGALITMKFDGLDEDEDVFRRGYLHNTITGGVSIHGFQVSVAMFYNRLITAGAHTMVGRWKVGNLSVAQKLSRKRRRIWIHEIC